MQGGELLPGRNGGAISYRWKIVKQPDGAKGRFADPSDPKTTFTTDKAGAYEFKLTASNAGGSGACGEAEVLAPFAEGVAAGNRTAQRTRSLLSGRVLFDEHQPHNLPSLCLRRIR